MRAQLALAAAGVLAAALVAPPAVRLQQRRARWRARWTSHQPDRHGRETMRWLFYELHPLAKIAVLALVLLGSIAVLVLALVVAK